MYRERFTSKIELNAIYDYEKLNVFICWDYKCLHTGGTSPLLVINEAFATKI